MTPPRESANTRSHTTAESGTQSQQPCHLDVAATDAAARLLNGAGKLTVVCHDGERGFTLETAFHGAGADGRRYLVAAPTDDAWPTMEPGRPLRVAMTIAAEAPVAEIRMNTAELSGHAWLTRCTEDEEHALLAEGPLPSDIARTLACWPGAQLWHVEPLRMTVHHVHGSHALDHEALKPRSAWPTPEVEVEAVEALRCQWGTYLTEIVPALRAAASVTAAFPDAPGSVHCATGRAYPVAVTDREIAFLVAEGPRRETVVVPLDRTVKSVEDLLLAVRDLTEINA
ncbi:hypothetical protein [Kocuria sp.]|uniref:hypothetical protein n=1 Tax=Kocuria sp. TaxID=1871328 RepID=UPI0026E05C84|nr:hypothetical protein [Kocuria sp.]MDO5618161.1 hypothetical protein [Kocuria sp.]